MAKKYNTRHKLTWFAPTSCWKKYRQGKVYYLGRGRCQSKGDRAGYEYALREWIQILASLDTVPATLGVPLYTTPSDWGDATASFATNYAAVATVTPIAHNVGDLPKDIAGLIAAYLLECRTLAESGQTCKGQYNDTRYRLNDFVAYCQHVKATDSIHLTNNLLATYRQAQISLIGMDKANGGISAISAKKRLQYLSRFIHWTVEREILAGVPLIVNRKFSAIKLPAPKPRFFTVEQVHCLLQNSSPLMGACILLAINTGFTQVDLSTLEHSHIDWESGILKRLRNKTQVPSEYILWPETIAAVQAVRTNAKKSKLLLLSDTGKPLVRESFKDDGRLVRVDSMTSMFWNLLKRCNLTDGRLAFKLFRKTSADMLAQKYPPYVVDKFLAHTPAKMRTHYVNEHSTTEFKEALEYLRTTYKLNEIKP